MAAGRCASSRPGTSAASPSRYEIDPEDLLRLTIETDDAGEVFWGIVHSHTHTPAVPSPTDIGLATIYREPLYVLVSLSDDEADPATGHAEPARLADRRRRAVRGPSGVTG